MRRLATVGLLMVLGSTLAIARVKVKVQHDPKFDFSTLKTWAWNPSAPGEVKVWVSANSKSEPVQRQYEPFLMQAVEEQLGKRGYARASGAAPDFKVTYYVLISMGSSAQQMGQFLPTNAQFGLPLFAPQTTSLEVYPQGTIVLDVASPPSGGMVWRGMAEAKIELENSEAKRVARLAGIIKDLVAKFPARKK